MNSLSKPALTFAWVRSALFVFLAANAACAAPESSPPEKQQIVLSPCVINLKKVEQFDGRATTSDGSKSKNYLAYEACKARGKAINRELEVVLAEGTPAAKLYAAFLIKLTDQTRGRQLLEGMLQDKTPVWYNAFGCHKAYVTVKWVARDLLHSKNDVPWFM